MWWWATTSVWPVALAISVVVVVIVAIVTIVVVAIVAIMMVAIVAIVIVSVVAIVIMAIVTIVVIAIVAIVLSPPSVVVVVVLPFSLADSCPVPWCPAEIAVGISCRALFSRVRWFSTSLAIPAISAPSVVIFVIVGPFFPLVRTIPFLFFVVTALLFVFLTVLAAIFLRSTNL